MDVNKLNEILDVLLKNNAKNEVVEFKEAKTPMTLTSLQHTFQHLIMKLI